MSDNGEINPELIEYNRRLKRAILDVMFRETETFYIHSLPHPRLVIGRRGLVEREKTEGIILVFGPYSVRRLEWDEQAVRADLQFGSRWEHVVIPYECIVRIFDKSGQVIMQWATMAVREVEQQPPGEKGEPKTDIDKPRKGTGRTGKATGRTGRKGAGSTARDRGSAGGRSTEGKTKRQKKETSRVIEVDFSRKDPDKKN